MNPRRALTALAVAAVLFPVAVSAAPAALASVGEGGDGSPAPTATASASPAATKTATPQATPSTSHPESASPEPSSPEPSSPGQTASASATTPPTGTPTGTADGTPTAGPGEPHPDSSSTAPPSATASPPEATAAPSVLLPGSPSPSPDESTDRDVPNDVCDVADFDVRVAGLPSSITAGTTTEPFTVVLDNTAGEDATRVQFGLAVALHEGSRDSDWLAAQRHVTVRYFDWQQDRWRNASTAGGVYTYVDIEAGRRYEMRLQLVLAPDAPPGTAGALAFSTRWDFDRAEGTSACVYDNEWYRFEITSPGSAPAASEVRPQGGSAPLVLRVEPGRADATRIDGALARTGSGPNLPLTALASLATVALGVAALRFGAKRRA